MRHVFWMALWFVALGALSCGGSEPSNGGSDAGNSVDGSGVTGEQACTEIASALCSKYDACAPLAITILFGDLATCNAVAKTACLGSLQATKTAATADTFLQCSQDLKMAACTDILAHQSPPSCHPKGGTVGNGMACGDDWQCMSGHCAIPDNTTCGVCASLAPAGGPCPKKTDDECEFGLVCADNFLCVTPGAAGASCDANHPCANPLVCAGATMTAQGTCTTGGALGAPCTSDQGCSLLQGLWCTRAANRTCASVVGADPGMPCGFMSVTAFSLCKGGGAGGGCNLVAGTAMGTCPRLGMPGEACTDTAPCKVGAKCVNGLCAVREPAACR
ncbi:MAG TPA: hypothetical protein VK540_08010 [Polyangiaceae bacterium]|jgi:hypothetical protein|nr:hypothetical protein [Polyangiaceae bacterium]